VSVYSDAEQALRNAIGYSMPVSIQGHPEITFAHRTVTDVDDTVRRIFEAGFVYAPEATDTLQRQLTELYDGKVGTPRKATPAIDYAALAVELRAASESPRLAQAPQEYYANLAIHELANALHRLAGKQ